MDVDIHMTMVLTWVMVTVRVGDGNAIAAAGKRFLKFIGLCMLCLEQGANRGTCVVCCCLHALFFTSTAQGGGGSFKNRKPIGRVGVTHGWQSESTDGPKGGWSCFFLEWLQRELCEQKLFISEARKQFTNFDLSCNFEQTQ